MTQTLCFLFLEKDISMVFVTYWKFYYARQNYIFSNFYIKRASIVENGTHVEMGWPRNGSINAILGVSVWECLHRMAT